MKKFIFFLISILVLSACAQTNSMVKPLKSANYEDQTKYIQKQVLVIDVTYNGVTHQYVCSGADGQHHFSIGGHWVDCKYCKEGNKSADAKDYLGIKTNLDGYSTQIIELLKAKDMEVTAAEEVIKAQQDYMKMHGLMNK